MSDIAEMTLGMQLRAAAQSWPNQEFLIDDTHRIPFADFDARVDRLAQGFLDQGLGRGDRIGIWLCNTADWICIMFAAARIGAVVVPINTRYKSTELQHILKDSEASAIVMTGQLWGIDFADIMRSLIPDLSSQTAGAIQSENLPDLRCIFALNSDDVPGALSLDEIAQIEIDRARIDAAEASVSPDDPAFVCYTSGTTGRSKGVVHTHHVLRQSQNIARILDLNAGDKVLAHMPFYHVAGSFMTILPAVLQGAALVLMWEWDTKKAAQLIEEERITHSGGIPTHYLDFIDGQKTDPRDLSSVRVAWIGGAAVTPEIVKAGRILYDTPHILSGYGMTENVACTTLAQFSDPPEVAEQNMGRLAGDYEARIVDTVTGQPLAADEVGELQVRGHIVMKEYFKNPEETSKAFTEDGWFRTGDLARCSAQGYYSIAGRSKEMFIVGGSNVFPAEVEAHLETHEDIRQALVVGVPHRRLGDVGFAFIQREADESLLDAESVIEHCRGQIADYKVPRHVVFVDSFPMTESGKIKRHVLEKRAAESLSFA